MNGWRLKVALATAVFSQQVVARPYNAGYLEAVADCRAGCQGNLAGCRETTVRAVFNAPSGSHLLRDSRAIASQRNASDSPGLAHEPQWVIETYPANSDRPVQMTIRPDINSCVGKSGDTQGVTFYTWRVSIERNHR